MSDLNSPSNSGSNSSPVTRRGTMLPGQVADAQQQPQEQQQATTQGRPSALTLPLTSSNSPPTSPGNGTRTHHQQQQQQQAHRGSVTSLEGFLTSPLRNRGPSGFSQRTVAGGGGGSGVVSPPGSHPTSPMRSPANRAGRRRSSSTVESLTADIQAVVKQSMEASSGSGGEAAAAALIAGVSVPMGSSPVVVPPRRTSPSPPTRSPVSPRKTLSEESFGDSPERQGDGAAAGGADGADAVPGSPVGDPDYDNDIPEEDDKEHHAADAWLDDAGMPPGFAFLYRHLFVPLLVPEDGFTEALRKLMICAGLLYCPLHLAIGIWWLTLAFGGDGGTERTALILAGVSAIFVAIFVFFAVYVRVRICKCSSEWLVNYWILGIAAGFCATGIAAPRFPSSTAAFALAVSAILVRSSLWIMHVAVSAAVYGVTSYNLVFLKLVGGWATATVPTVHEGSPVENLLLTIVGTFIVVIICAAMFLQHVEHKKLVDRSSSTAVMSGRVAHGLAHFDLKEVKGAFHDFKNSDNFDDPTSATFYREMTGIVKTLSAFSRFCPSSVVSELLLRGGKVSQTLSKRKAVVFFCDLVSFTTLTSLVDADTLNKLLSVYFEVSTKILAQHKAVVVKYIGDACMVEWPDTVKDACIMAVAASLHLHGAVKTVLSPQFVNEAAFALGIRIGLHVGECSVGIIGSRARLAFDIVGAVPTLASRLEGAGKYFHSNLTVSEEVLQETFVQSSISATSNNNSSSGSKSGTPASGKLSYPTSPKSASSPPPSSAAQPREEVVPLFASRRIGKIIAKGKLEPTAVYQIVGVLPNAARILGAGGKTRRASASSTNGFDDSMFSASAGISGGGVGGGDDDAASDFDGLSESGGSRSPGSPGLSDTLEQRAGGSGGVGGGSGGQQPLSLNDISPKKRYLSTHGALNRKLDAAAAVAQAAAFFRASPIAVDALAVINAGQLLYERGDFSAAAGIYKQRLLNCFTFPDSLGTGSSFMNSAHLGMGSGRSADASSNNAMGSEKSSDGVTIVGGGGGAATVWGQRWPVLLEEAQITKQLLDNKVEDWSALAEEPPDDFDGICKMTEMYSRLTVSFVD